MKPLLALILVWGVACTSIDAPPPTLAPSLWGTIYPIAEAPQTFAPSLISNPENDSVLLAWTAPDSQEVRHYASLLPTRPTILALNANAPFLYTLLPATATHTHLFWLDNDRDSNEVRLFTALIGNDLVATLDSTRLSGGRTPTYSAISLSDGTVRVVWSEGVMGAELLYTTTLDAQGRSTFAQRINRVAGAHPALTRANDGRVWLFWLDDGALWRALLTEEQPQEMFLLERVERLLDAPNVDEGERLEAFSVAQDSARFYAFWQIVGREGVPSLQVASGGVLASTWNHPRSVGISVLGGNVQTGFNSGAVNGAIFGAQPVGWGTPLEGQHPVLPMVATLGEDLVMLYWRNGEPIGAQTLAKVGVLFGAPTLTTDESRHLWVAWSQPKDATTATLYLTGTRR